MPRFFLTVLVLLGATVAPAHADWPRFRGPDGLGVSKATGLPTTWSHSENVVWKTPLPGPGTSSPAVAGDDIYLTCFSGYNVPGQPRGDMESLRLHLVCLNRGDGSVRWTRDVMPKLPEQDKIRDDHGYASATPAVDAERVYVCFGKTGVLTFDRGGKQLWQADIGSGLSGWGSAASPILYEDLVIVNASVESDSLIALDKATGKEAWRVRGVRESWNVPLLVSVGGKTELVVAMPRQIWGLDPKTGERLWTCNNEITWYVVPSLVAADGVVWCLGGRSGVAAAAVRAGGKGDVTATHRLWTGTKGSNVTSPIVHDGHLYWMNDSRGVAYCAEAQTGKIVYEERVERADQVYASPVLADGKLYYVSRTGRTFVLAVGPKYERLATNDLSDRSTFNASPAVAGNKIYLRSDKFLYCLGTK